MTEKSASKTGDLQHMLLRLQQTAGAAAAQKEAPELQGLAGWLYMGGRRQHSQYIAWVLRNIMLMHSVHQPRSGHCQLRCQRRC